MTVRRLLDAADAFLLIGVGTRGAPGARAPPSFQSVPCPLYMSCTTNFIYYILCPPNQKVFPTPLLLRLGVLRQYLRGGDRLLDVNLPGPKLVSQGASV